MGFFKNLFKKNSIEESEWDNIQASKEEINLADPYMREQYVISCLEQMQEASREIDRINSEYAVVTSYLKDMEEIEGLPPEDKSDLEKLARNIHDLRKQHDHFVLTPGTMTEQEYNRMTLLGDEAVDGIEKLAAEEELKGKIKNDLSKVGKERQAYSYRRHEVNAALENSRGMATIFMVAAVVLVVILFLLQVFLKLDVTIGYYIAVAALAISLTIIYVKYVDYEKERKRIESTSNELILLENKVKIRYVNNKNLLDYLYSKYQVSSSAELKDLYTRFIKEREDRRAFERNEAAYEEAVSRLLRSLKNQRIKDPEVWMHQSDAIYDNREMVEVRHNLIGRRQKLRKQIEYNEQIAIEAGDEIKDIMKKYPESSRSIMELLDKYGQN